MPKFDMILELLRADLTAPKTLLKQVIQEINDRHGHSEAQLPEFFATVYTTLEEYQVDLLFSPQFTPAKHNRLRYIPFLNDKALSQQEIASIKSDLLSESLSLPFVTPDEGVEISVPLHEVFIDRFVNLLKLDASLPESAAPHRTKLRGRPRDDAALSPAHRWNRRSQQFAAVRVRRSRLRRLRR